MILMVYADDSADWKRKTVFTVGGFMGYRDVCRSRTKLEGLSRQKRLEYFKASEAQNLDGQFDSLRLMMALALPVHLKRVSGMI